MLGVRGSVNPGASAVFLTGWGHVGGVGVGSDSMTDLFGAIGFHWAIVE